MLVPCIPTMRYHNVHPVSPQQNSSSRLRDLCRASAVSLVSRDMRHRSPHPLIRKCGAQASRGMHVDGENPLLSSIRFLDHFNFLPVSPGCSHEFCRCSTRLVPRLCFNVTFDNSGGPVLAKVSVTILNSDALLSSLIGTAGRDDIFERVEDCVRALWYLGKTSDMVQSVAKILGAALKKTISRNRRQDLQETVNDSRRFLDTKLWHEFDNCEKTVVVGYKL
jgi:hypothetical protein